ncbi:MAG: hypothetical protein JWP25_7136 [Bradyrhizobium sp.]|jgi:hypothetical protein|nr:hypothetical protein [Bradyrhizobium sp.]
MKSDRLRFVAGLLCGGIAVAIVWGASAWWKLRSEQETVLYDYCLAGNGGNTVGCDAFMRTFKRAKAKDDALEKILNEDGAKMLAAGSSKRDVVKWATEMGGVGSQISNAAGISLRELQSNNY